MKTTQLIKDRLEYLRGEIRAERISYGEQAELQSLIEHIDEDDVELLEHAGVKEGRTPKQHLRIVELQMQIMDWMGDDSEVHDYAEVLAEIATGGYAIEEFLSDVKQYQEATK